MSDPEINVTTESQPQAAAARGRFAGRVALVTGASDRGIGGAIAERFAQEGAAVALVSRTEPKRLLKRLNRLQHGSAWLACDVTHRDDVRRAVDQTISQFGRLDVLVNNAGVEYARPFEKFTDEQWEELLDVNLHGAIRMTRAALPHLPSPGGVIINITSALAMGGCPSFSIYSAGKAGLIGLTQALAWELAPRGIRVVAVAPALVATPMTLKHMEHLTPKVREHLEAIHPLGVGMPGDVSGAIAFLASEDAHWITGITLPVGWAPHFDLPVGQFMTADDPAAPPAKPR